MLFGDNGCDIIYSGKDFIDAGAGNNTIWLGSGQDMSKL
jgi:Ca2+-binding RTX toxin-like protein